MATTASVTLTGGMHFKATVGDRYSFDIDTLPEHGGTVPGATPMELVLAGLAGCTAFDVISILRKARQEVTGFRVEVRGERAEHDPRVYTHIRVEYLLRGRRLSEDAVRRAIELSESKYCSVGAMLRSTAKIESSYRIEEES